MPVEAKDSASSEVVITAAKGWPFPIGLPKVTMSGTTSKEKHSYDLQATHSTSTVHSTTTDTLDNWSTS